MSFKDKTVIITGAAQGIGRAFAHAFAKEGAYVIIGDVKEESAKSVELECKNEGGNALAIPIDLTDEQSVKDFVAKVIAERKKIDVLINNASIFSTIRMGPFEDITEAEWDDLMAVNLKGVWRLCKEVIPHMKAEKYGKIVNIGSGVVSEGRGGYAHYVTSKAGLLGMTRAMAREVGDWNITVNCAMPGSVKTEIPRGTVTPEQTLALNNSRCIKRTMTPEDLLGAVLFFASPGSDFITGQSLLVNGGGTMQ